MPTEPQAKRKREDKMTGGRMKKKTVRTVCSQVIKKNKEKMNSEFTQTTVMMAKRTFRNKR